MEIRVHGRGGQGGVTCAKMLAAAYARQGKSVQTFGDYAGERSGAPVRAYTRVSDGPITNRNKVYEPDHVVVLDPHLLGQDTVAGLRAGGTLLLNSTHPPETYRDDHGGFRVATVDAAGIELPFFFTALKVGTTLAFIGAIVGEFFGGTSNVLGRVVLQAISGGKFDVAWAAILIGATAAILAYIAVTLIERAVIPWYWHIHDAPE